MLIKASMRRFMNKKLFNASLLSLIHSIIQMNHDGGTIGGTSSSSLSMIPCNQYWNLKVFEQLMYQIFFGTDIFGTFGNLITWKNPKFFYTVSKRFRNPSVHFSEPGRSIKWILFIYFWINLELNISLVIVRSLEEVSINIFPTRISVVKLSSPTSCSPDTCVRCWIFAKVENR